MINDRFRSISERTWDREWCFERPFGREEPHRSRIEFEIKFFDHVQAFVD